MVRVKLCGSLHRRLSLHTAWRALFRPTPPCAARSVAGGEPPKLQSEAHCSLRFSSLDEIDVLSSSLLAAAFANVLAPDRRAVDVAALRLPARTLA